MLSIPYPLILECTQPMAIAMAKIKIAAYFIVPLFRWDHSTHTDSIPMNWHHFVIITLWTNMAINPCYQHDSAGSKVIPIKWIQCFIWSDDSFALLIAWMWWFSYVLVGEWSDDVSRSERSIRVHKGVCANCIDSNDGFFHFFFILSFNKWSEEAM